MNDNRNTNVVLPSSDPPRPHRPRAKRMRWGLGLVIVAALSTSSLAGCSPHNNRLIGLSTFANAGANHTTLAHIDCIMYRESRYKNAVSHRDANGSHDAGLFQINSVNARFWRKVTGTDYYKNWANPWLNARVAVGLWRAAGLAPWRGGCLL